MKDHSINYKNLMLKQPKWTIKYGSGLMLLFLLLIFFLSYIIKYPEYIEAKINIVSENHIKRLISKRGGNLHLLSKNGDTVTQGQQLAFIENLSLDIMEVDKITDSIGENLNLLDSNKFNINESINWGELEPFYIDFIKKRKDYFIFKDIATRKNNRKNLENSLSLNKKAIDQIIRERNILERGLSVEKEKINRFQKLYREGIISKNDLNKAEQDYLEYERRLSTNGTSTIQASINENETYNNVYNLDNVIKEEEIKYRQDMINAFKRLKAEINNWHYTYSFIAPNKGIVFFNSNWSNGQFVSQDQEFAAIVPSMKSEIFCTGIMPSFQSGKVKKGQDVKVYLDGYNYEEYGIIQGKVDYVYPIPERNKDGDYFYKVRIILTNGLNTSLKKVIPYTPDLNGSAKIVTKDLSLLERLFIKIRKGTSN